MPSPKVILVILPLVVAAGSAVAATAHNSQAGALGPTTNNCAATAYFPADSGCLTSYFEHWGDDDVLPPPARLRHRRVDPDADD